MPTMKCFVVFFVRCNRISLCHFRRLHISCTNIMLPPCTTHESRPAWTCYEVCRRYILLIFSAIYGRHQIFTACLSLHLFCYLFEVSSDIDSFLFAWESNSFWAVSNQFQTFWTTWKTVWFSMQGFMISLFVCMVIAYHWYIRKSGQDIIIPFHPLLKVHTHIILKYALVYYSIHSML